MQLLTYVIIRAYITLSRSQVHQRSSRYPKGAYIIAANHTSSLDPFIITTALGFRNVRALMPFRFMATPYFLKITALRPFMRWLGSYPSHSFRDWCFGIDASNIFMDAGDTIVIFPQGRRTTSINPAEAKRGVIVLAQAHPGTNIIPIRLDRQSRKFWFNRYTIIVGRPVNPEGYTPEGLMEHIIGLQTKNHREE